MHSNKWDHVTNLLPDLPEVVEDLPELFSNKKVQKIELEIHSYTQVQKYFWTWWLVNTDQIVIKDTLIKDIILVFKYRSQNSLKVDIRQLLTHRQTCALTQTISKAARTTLHLKITHIHFVIISNDPFYCYTSIYVYPSNIHVVSLVELLQW